MQLSNLNLTETALIRQIGVYSMDPDEGEILYHIVQYELPVPIPAYMANHGGVVLFDPEINVLFSNGEIANTLLTPDFLITTQKLMEHNQNPNAHGNRFNEVYDMLSDHTRAFDDLLARLTTHSNTQVVSELGAHGLRYNAQEEEMQIYDVSADIWVSVSVGVPPVISISSVPSQNGSLTYNGSVQGPVWDNYSSAMLTIGGTTSAANAGTYTVTFTPNDGYQWADGTITAKTVNWTIGKAAGSLSLSATSLSLDMHITSRTLTVTRAGDGAITARSGNTGVATVFVSGTTVTVKGIASGTATITVSVAAGTNHAAPADAACTVSSSIPSTTLNSNSWAVIKEASEAGLSSTLWSVGDTKNITLTTGETLTLQIYDFNHDDLPGGGKAGITFGLKNLMADTRRMEATNINTNDFTGSEMYGWLTGTLLPSLPSDLRTVIKPVTKKTSAGNQSTTIRSETMSIFLFSEVEYFGATPNSVAGEGSRYPVFTDDNSRIKRLSNGTGSGWRWWGRTPVKESASLFCISNWEGGAAMGAATTAGGVCFGFCV